LPSRQRGSCERALALFGGQIRRCHACRARLCWFGLASIRLGENVKDGSLAPGVLLAGGLLLCAAAVFWMIARLGAIN